MLIGICLCYIQKYPLQHLYNVKIAAVVLHPGQSWREVSMTLHCNKNTDVEVSSRMLHIGLQ